MTRSRQTVKNFRVVPVLLMALILAVGPSLSLAVPPVSALTPPSVWNLTDYTFQRADCTIQLGTGGGPLEPASGCDDYFTDMLERPTIQQPDPNKRDDYYARLDIERVLVGEDTTYFYFAIDVVGLDPGVDSLPDFYGYEIDFDYDNRGDYFLEAHSPKDVGTSWSQKDIYLYYDTDGQVGDTNPLTPQGNGGENGYETTFWEVGYAPADACWVRISPYDETVVETAINKAVVGNPAGASLRGWASKGSQNYQILYYHDEYNQEEYGSPYQSSLYYAAGNIYEVDNSKWGGPPGEPELWIDKEWLDLNGGFVEPGDTIRYTIEYGNNGMADATGVYILDTFDPTDFSNITNFNDG
ncbi:MAG: hypothetical protein KAH98_01690, partial [Dehalococcoidia bacterium]|nr:hypothetical protein [Dehalococcoidia bacterium]